ncbi:Aste57867_14101 [Aphanomyces stellatus]|uniref:Aste57867_14101 protein n=1 Tax=Aphanomyces stellatus TaxID=120398 RepID=A0A485L1G7_9STRA|nr:hypothetical protein As57867_014050 [Aphanomyces stellatus]VFT90929.1 Aste57867_14101 [Aphanomyces stellatus]
MPSVLQNNKRGRYRAVSLEAGNLIESICPEFAERGHCKFGYRCKHMHIISASHLEDDSKHSRQNSCNQDIHELHDSNHTNNKPPSHTDTPLLEPKSSQSLPRPSLFKGKNMHQSHTKQQQHRPRSKSHGAYASDGTAETSSNDDTSLNRTHQFSDTGPIYSNNQEPQYDQVVDLTHTEEGSWSPPETSWSGSVPECPPLEYDMHRWLSHEVESYIQRNDAKMHSFREKQRKAINAVNRVVSELWNGVGFEVYGSTYTQLCLPNSDVDCVIVPSTTKPTPTPIEMLQLLRDKLATTTWAQQIELLGSARIPILKLQYTKVRSRSAVMLDITCAHSRGHSGIAARSLVEQCKYNMPALRPLVIVLKAHLNAKGLNAAYSGGLSSYALVLLVIRFLQFQGDVHTAFLDAQEPEPQHEASTSDVHPCLIYTFFRNGMVVWQGTVGMLLLQFLDHHVSFDFGRYGISIANGGEYYEVDIDYPYANLAPMVHIVDPVGYNHNIGNAFRIYEIVEAWRVWRDLLLQRVPLTADINGVETTIIVSEFSDRIFLAVTQVGTFGTIIEASSKENLNGNSHVDISIRLGKRDDPLLLVYARQFLEQFGMPRGKSIVAAVGLKDRSAATFEVVMNSLRSLLP